MEIDSIVNSLKTMSQVSNYKIYVSGSLPMNVGFRLKAKATQADLKKFDKINYSLPNDYLAFISQINGAELFTDGKYIQNVNRSDSRSITLAKIFKKLRILPGVG